VAVVAVDGTKVHASASQHQNLDYDAIAREILAEADAVDRAEDERFGERRGDGLPPELSTAQGRRGWLRDARRRLDERRAAEARPVPKSRPARPREGQRRVEEEHRVHRRANDAYEAYRARGVMKDGRRFGRPPTPYQPPARPEGKVNITDPDSRNLKTPRGYMQGYDAQAVCDENQLVVAAELNTDSPDFGHLEPMVSAAERELAGAGIAEAPAVVVADAGDWHHDQMDQLAGRGIRVPIPPDAGKRRGARPGWGGGRYAFMRRVLETDLGRRQVTIEPVFANTKFNRRIDRFLRRGRSACRAEWRLITATHTCSSSTATRPPWRAPNRGSAAPPAAPPRRSPGGHGTGAQLCATATKRNGNQDAWAERLGVRR
jgi:hypothetical protein